MSLVPGTGAFAAAAGRFLRRSPILFVCFFYLGGALGAVVQNILIFTSARVGPAFYQVSLVLMVGLVVVAPLWGVLGATWHLLHRRRLAESLCALVLSLPLLSVVAGVLQRTEATRERAGQQGRAELQQTQAAAPHVPVERASGP